jgi:transposase
VRAAAAPYRIATERQGGYPRETQEMVFDAHDRAFAFFKGACTRGIYDNMKTAVETIFIGKDRAYNRRFMQMCGRYLVKDLDDFDFTGPPFAKSLRLCVVVQLTAGLKCCW